MLKFYTIQGGGRLTSCVGICLWLLEELKTDYEIVHVDLDKFEHKSDSYLKLNPNGKVPCLVDDKFVIWESLAINYYIARKYKPELMGKNAEENSLIDQWIFWMLSELQPPIVNIFKHARLPAAQKSPALFETWKMQILQHTTVLEKELTNKNYLVGDRFTLADLNVAAFSSIHYILHSDLSLFPNFSKWLNTSTARPGLAAAREKKLVIM
jgi:glutathione S-transferase